MVLILSREGVHRISGSFVFLQIWSLVQVDLKLIMQWRQTFQMLESQLWATTAS